jgi:hypothetical protein
MKTVRVTLEGGVIQDVEVPKGVRVIVHDYDTEDIEEKDLAEDDNGLPCIETEWE